MIKKLSWAVLATILSCCVFSTQLNAQVACPTAIASCDDAGGLVITFDTSADAAAFAAANPFLFGFNLWANAMVAGNQITYTNASIFPASAICPDMGGIMNATGCTSCPPDFVITTQPMSQDACFGDNISFSVAASGGAAPLSYQWQEDCSGNGSFTNIFGATNTTLFQNSVNSSDRCDFRVIITDAEGCELTSDVATLGANSPTSITTQPMPVTTCVGEDASFTVVMRSTTVTFQWQSDCSGTFTDIAGATSATYTISPAQTTDACNYQVVVTNASDCITISNAVGLTVDDSPTISTQPMSQDLCFGDDATFSATASGGIAPLTYQWQNDCSGTFMDIAGATSSTYSISGAQPEDACNYQVVVTDNNGCEVVSDAVALVVNSPTLTLLTDDADNEICPGSPIEICTAGQLLLLQTSNDNAQIFGFTEITASGFNFDMALPGASGFPSTTTFGIDIDPVSGLLYIVAGPSSMRLVYVYDLNTSTLTGPLGQIVSSSGSANVQAITFDGAGNLWGVFNGGVLEMINLTTYMGIANGFAPLPSNGSVGLTWDFDNNQIIYTTNALVYGVNTTTGTPTLLQTFTTICNNNLQGIDYIGNGMLYVTSSSSCDAVYLADINTGLATQLFAPQADFGAGGGVYKDIVYIPGSATWTDDMGNSLGTSTCITVSPTATTTYTASFTDANGCMVEEMITITTSSPVVSASTSDFTICQGDAIPDFEVDEILTELPPATYQVDDGVGEGEINTTIVSWGNMFPINTTDCDNGCSVVSFDAGFGKDNNPANGPSIAGTIATWIIYTDDDGDPTAGLSAPLATGTHTIVNSDFTANGVIDNISLANLDICSTIATNPFLFISLSYTDNIGTVNVTAIDQSSSNGQSWIVSAANGTQADWAGGLNNPFGGNWIIRANLDCQAPCTTNWFDAPTAGTMVGTGTTFNSNGATGEETTTADTNTPGTYTFYAEADCDACLSESRAPFTLTIESAELQCMAQDITITLDGTGNATIAAADIDNGSMLGCEGGTLNLSLDQTSFNCDNVLTTNTVTLTVDDGIGNSSTCTATVTVLPDATCTDPSFDCPATQVSCTGDPFSLNPAESGGTYSGTAAPFVMNDVLDPTGMSPGSYTLTYTVNGFVSELCEFIVVRPMKSANAGSLRN